MVALSPHSPDVLVSTAYRLAYHFFLQSIYNYQRYEPSVRHGIVLTRIQAASSSVGTL